MIFDETKAALAALIAERTTLLERVREIDATLQEIAVATGLVQQPRARLRPTKERRAPHGTIREHAIAVARADASGFVTTRALADAAGCRLDSAAGTLSTMRKRGELEWVSTSTWRLVGGAVVELAEAGE